MFPDVSLPDWLQYAIVVGAGILAVWIFIALAVIYQAALAVLDFIAEERRHRGWTRPTTSDE